MSNSRYPLVENLEAIKKEGIQDPCFAFSEIMRVLREAVLSQGQDPDSANVMLRFDVAYNVFRDVITIKKMIINMDAHRALTLVAKELNKSNYADFKDPDCASIFLLVFHTQEITQDILNDSDFLQVIDSVFNEKAEEFVAAAKYHLHERILEVLSCYPRVYVNAEVYFEAQLAVYQERHRSPLFGDVVKAAFAEVEKKGISNIRRGQA